MKRFEFSRRDVVKAGLALGTLPGWATASGTMLTKPIPASGEQLPVIGLGTYKAFDVFGWPWEISHRREMIDMMIDKGASLVDSSPQYEPSEEILGDVIKSDNRRKGVFLATKVWMDGQAHGVRQMNESFELMRADDHIELMQVHNLRDTDAHLATIREWQQEGRIRYNGITHWEDSALPALEAAMKKHEPDFVQIHYSMGERAVEERILPMAKDMGIAVLINRPYMHGRLFRVVSGQDVPDWAQEYADTWGQFFLKFIVSHPAVNCVIPATDKMEHLEDNLGAGTGPMPDEATRQRMVNFFESLS